MNAPNPYAPPAADLALQVPSVNVSMLADRGSRLGASLLDFLLVFSALLAMMAAIALSGGFHHDAVGAADADSMKLVATMGLAFVPVAALLLFQAYRLSTTGQTLGKKWVGIRVVRLDGGPVNFFTAVLLRAIVPGLIGSVPLFGGLFSIIDVLFIFREDRRCLHDLIATTKVVRA